MFTNDTSVIYYSWEEIDDVISTIVEKLYYKTSVEGLRYVGTKSAAFAHILSAKSEIPITMGGESDNVLLVALDNLNGTPDIVITEFVHDDDNFSYHVPEIAYETQPIDVEGRVQRIIFPWDP